ncbi:MAG: hypothetical protein ACYDBH_00515 [Acidobacteriaceae bacterium]
MTYLRNDGQESGAPIATPIELTVTGGLQLTNLAVSGDPTVTYKVIYATAVGGETLFRVGVIPNSQTTFLVDEVRVTAAPLVTQFLSPPPAGQVVAEARGIMVVAVNDRLYVSEPYSMELFDLRKSYPFGELITMLAPISDGHFFRQHGIYVGTRSGVIWVQGDSPDKWQYHVVSEQGVIPGTMAIADGELLGAGDSKEKIVFFATTTGFVAAKMGGIMVNLTQERFAYPVMDRGAAIVRRFEGMAQLVCSMQGTAVQGNIYE